MRFTSALAAPLLAATASARFIMYADEWHPTRPTDPADRAGIDHVVLAFAMANNTAAFQPKVPVATIRKEFPLAKIMIAIGGWGDTVGFTEASKTDAGIQKFASDAHSMIENLDVDGIDIDWEYPGGNGADYKQVPNSEKVHEIPAFPKLLSAVRTAIGKDKLLSIAVPGKKIDMIAFTNETGPLIWPSVDYVNVMSYDLMNRRDKVTAHHTSVQGALEAVKNYLAIGAPAQKINLGFSYYAKYFTVAPDTPCATGLGCTIVLAEDPVTGKDTLTSGAWTFEPAHMNPVNASALTVSFDGTCGPEKGTKCSTGCCSQYGNCGFSPEHCSGACQHAFGTGCTDSDVAGSWPIAAARGLVDEKSGGRYYHDATNGLFWTWDTPEFISKKFDQIVRKYKLGGVMAWSLGEDSKDWSHIRQMASEIAKSGSSSPSTPSSYNYVAPVSYAPVVAVPSPSRLPGAPVVPLGPVSKPSSTSKKTYNVVYVDGVGGPNAAVPSSTLAKVVVPDVSKATGLPVVSVDGDDRQDKIEGVEGKDWEWVWYNEDGTPWTGDE